MFQIVHQVGSCCGERAGSVILLSHSTGMCLFALNKDAYVVLHLYWKCMLFPNDYFPIIASLHGYFVSFHGILETSAQDHSDQVSLQCNQNFFLFSETRETERNT